MASTPRATLRRLFVVPALTVLASVVLLQGGASATPEQPQPTVASLTDQLDQLAEHTEALTEQYNGARIEVQRQEGAVAAADEQVRQAATRFTAARAQFAALVAARYQAGAFSSTGAILTSRDGDSYLQTLEVQQLVAEHSANVLHELDEANAAASTAAKTAADLLARATQARDELARKRDEVISKTAETRALRATLTAEQRQAYSGRNAPTVAEMQAISRAAAPPSDAARRAVEFALAQVGKPYVWAAAGPNAFDCSGLTMTAWAQAGVSLPHYSVAQYAFGRAVPANDLQPGDLVFLYDDLHHVEIYVGNGLAVSAPQEGEPVKIVRVADQMNVFYGAKRLV